MIYETKSPEIENEFVNACLILRLLAEDFIRLSNSFGIVPVITRVLEKVDGSSGVHEAGRGIDFRDEHAGTRLYTDEQRSHIAKAIEAKWHRTDGKPSIIWHSFNGGPIHAHLQISVNTMVYFPKT